jgi:2-dehydro-3-deoxygluconokinase
MTSASAPLSVPARGDPHGDGLDLLSLGALVHRLDPGVIPFRKARSCQIHVSGGEYNVAANLAACFGLRTAIATAIVDHPLGDLVREQVRTMGVRGCYKEFAHNGVDGPNIATVYSDRGQGIRPPLVFYNRAHEAAAMLQPGDFDWKSIFAGGVRWLHSGGIFAALSRSTSAVILEAIEAAKDAGAIVSFDLNFRNLLWKKSGNLEQARQTLRKIVSLVDVLVGNEEDLQKGLGIAGPKISADSKLDPAAFLGMIGKVRSEFPQLKVLATTLREVHSANRHSWSAVAWAAGRDYLAPRCELDVLDRVGAGDGFAAGFFYGILEGLPMEEALKMGWAHGALLTSYPGDTTMATLEMVRALAAGLGARIER